MDIGTGDVGNYITKELMLDDARIPERQHITYYNPNIFWFYIYAPTEKHAIKIANDTRIMFIASGIPDINSFGDFFKFFNCYKYYFSSIGEDDNV
jgi:hypothetical protein